MKTKNIILIALLVLLTGLASCQKDHDIPTGKVFNGGSGGGSTTDSLTISVTANPSEGGTVSGGGKYLKGKTCVVAASANEGYVFSNWTENGTQVSTSVSYSFTVDADRTLVANFSVSTGNNFTITAVASPEYGGVISGSGTYQQGQNCTVIATAEAGYTFVNWTENGSQVSTEASYAFTVTGNRTLVANFTLCDYTNIILNELNGETKFIEIYNKGTSDVPLNGMYIMKDDYVAGSIWTADVTIVAPAGGYVLLYSEDVAVDHPEHPENLIFHSGLSSKKSIRVTLFTPNGPVRDEFTRGTTGEWGQTISNEAPQSYARTPNGGDWKLANPTPGEANPSTGEDIPDVETPVNYTITVSANPSNGGTVTGGGTYQQGQTCTVTAIANEAYTFTNWTENGSQVSEDAIYTFVVTSNRTLIANFAFVQGEGSGTFEDPYNVAAGIGLQSEEPIAWVHGYIVGAVKSGLSSVTSNADINWNAPFDLATNVVIADDVTCHEISQCIIVNLPAGKPLRTQVNLMDNPTNLGKHLAVLGKLRPYFGQSGLRDSSGTEDDFVLSW